MKLPKITIKGVIFALAAAVLVFFGAAWRFNWFDLNETESANNSDGFLTYIDHGLKDEDRVKLEEKINDLENRLATDQELAKDLSQWLQLGNLKYQLGDLAGAKDVYETKILAGHPADAAALENLGQALYEMRDYEGAELKWRAAISVNPWEVTYLKLTNLIEEKFPDRQAEIQGILEEAIASIGQTPGLLKELGSWFEKNEKYDLALSHYKVAKQLAPEDETIDDLIEELRGKMIGN